MRNTCCVPGAVLGIRDEWWLNIIQAFRSFNASVSSGVG